MTPLAQSDVYALEKSIDQIYQIADRFGLDPFPLHYEIVPAAIMYEFGAYGIPGRFAHWTHGRAYHQIKTMYDYGLSKIYELVINTDPCYAFLMEGNTMVQNMLVVAHVVGHSDFFKNNAYFARTNRKMLESASLNAERIRRYEFAHGRLEVERFLDSVLAIQEHVDPHPDMRVTPDVDGKRRIPESERPPRPTPYDDLLSLDGIGQKHRLRVFENAPRRIPEEPDKDILQFI